MTPGQHFCGSCGSPLTTNVRFCTQCGAPVLQQVQPAGPKIPVNERFTAVVAGLTKGAFLSAATQYALLVTPDRVIIAEITPAMIQAQIERAAEVAKAKGSGFFGQAFAKMGASLHHMDTLRQAAQTFLPMEPAAVLRMRAGNIAIPRPDITRFTLARHQTTRNVGTGSRHHHETVYHFHFVIVTRNGTFEYDAPDDTRFKEELFAVFPGQVDQTG